MIFRAVGSQDVQPLASAANLDVKPLPDQQPAVVDQLEAPDGMAGIDEVCRRRDDDSYRDRKGTGLVMTRVFPGLLGKRVLIQMRLCESMCCGDRPNGQMVLAAQHSG